MPGQSLTHFTPNECELKIIKSKEGNDSVYKFTCWMLGDSTWVGDACFTKFLAVTCPSSSPQVYRNIEEKLGMKWIIFVNIIKLKKLLGQISIFPSGEREREF